jgi:hypothetical protein
MFQPAKHVRAKFQLSSIYTDGLRQIIELFSRKFQDFRKKISRLSNFEKSSKGQLKRLLSFLKRYQNFKILNMRCIPAQKIEGKRNLKTVAARRCRRFLEEI